MEIIDIKELDQATLHSTSDDQRTVAIVKGVEGVQKAGVPYQEKKQLAENIRAVLAMDAEANVRFLQDLRRGQIKDVPARKLSIWDFMQEKYTISREIFWDVLGINPDTDGKGRFFSTGDVPSGLRWLYAEIILDAIEAGFDDYLQLSDIIGNTYQVAARDVRVPFIPISDATPYRIGEGQRIPVGNMQFRDKPVTLFKHGIGLETTYEVMQFASINLINKFLADVGRKLAAALITESIDTAISGEIMMLDGLRNAGASAPVIGVADPAQGFTYADMLDIFLATAQFDRATTTIITNRAQARAILNVAEIKGGDFQNGLISLATKPPLARTKELYAHEAVGEGLILLLNQPNALAMLEYGGLTVETDKIVANQVDQTFVTVIAGIVKMNRDAAIVVDVSKATSDAGFAITDHPEINPATRVVKIRRMI